MCNGQINIKDKQVHEHIVKPCLTALLFAINGCSAGDNTTKDNIEKQKREDHNISSIKKVIINGSPTPPEGYQRPVINSNKIKN